METTAMTERVVASNLDDAGIWKDCYAEAVGDLRQLIALGHGKGARDGDEVPGLLGVV